MHSLKLCKKVKLDPLEFPRKIKAFMGKFCPKNANDKYSIVSDKEEEWCHLGAGLRSMAMLLGGRERQVLL